MVFVVLEGFSGTGKTTLAKDLEKLGWLRLPESAHVVPKTVPLADRADTFADYSLIGATLAFSSEISRLRGTRNLVSEGYLLSDLAYARIRFELGRSDAYSGMMAICRKVLEQPPLKPDVYILLVAENDTIDLRQLGKSGRERNLSEFFRDRYYTALAEIHRELGESNIEKVVSDAHPGLTLKTIMERLRKWGVGPL